MSLITISQSIGCDGGEIARQVSDALQVTLYDDARLKEEALGMGLHSAELKSLQEKSPGFFERVLSRKPEVYLDLMKSVVYKVAGRGEGVIFGHGSQVLLQEFGCALHVLIHGSVEARTENLAQKLKLSREAALQMVYRSDAEQKGFFQFAFRKEWNEPALYDLCINIGKLGAKPAADLIIAAARAPEMKTCSLNALDTMERLSLAKRVEAALFEKQIPMTALNVDVPQKGIAHVSGLVFSPEDQKRIPDVLKAVPGVADVRVDVSLYVGGI
jgi:cytidylate kinase